MASRDFLLPDLGEGLEDAEVVSWKVKEGDRVELNQPLVEVNTAKALVEIPSPWEGVVERLHAGAGDVVRVGSPLISIRVGDGDGPGHGDEAGGEAEAPKRRAVLVGYGVSEEEDAATPRRRRGRGTDEGGREGPVRAAPPVRRLAKELGVDLRGLVGSGPGGRVTREDVLQEAATRVAREDVPREIPTLAPPAEAAEPAEPAGESEARPEAAGEEAGAIPVTGTRRLIAEKMSRAWREIPHVTTFLTVDATWLQAFREELSTESGERISPLPVVVRSLIEVCREHPKLNSSFDAERSEIVLHGKCHVGIATDTERGLLVPVVHDAEKFGVTALSREIARLTEEARTGTAKPRDLLGSTITVTNVGTFGAEYGTPIINHPEAAILALGALEPRALVVEGRVEARPAVTLSLSFDHRVLDGAEAGRALRALGDLLESPFRLGALPR